MRDKRIYLSPPNVGEREKQLLTEAVESGWIAPVGPQLDLFETELERLFENRRVLAVNSGTSALHLALILSDVGSDDTVVVGTFTFAACANVILYQGAIPVFLDSEPETWNLDPALLDEYLQSCAKRPKAVIITHLYGVPAKIEEIKRICDEYEVTLIEDAAEAIGSTVNDQHVGSFGTYGIISFNGNKLITTSGGGALIVPDHTYDRGLHLATQANTGDMGYDHQEVGYNYRLSNVLAGVGIAQLEKMKDFVKRKRDIFDFYSANLPSTFQFQDEPKHCFCNRWLTTPLGDESFTDPLALIRFLEEKNIESRRLWKPLHLNKAYTDFNFFGSNVAENLYERGLCLPSGSGMTGDDLNYVAEQINSYLSASLS